MSKGDDYGKLLDVLFLLAMPSISPWRIAIVVASIVSAGVGIGYLIWGR